MSSHPWKLRCVETGAEYAGDDPRYRSDTGSVLDVEHDLERLSGQDLPALFDQRLASTKAIDRSGVWRFRELILPVSEDLIVARGEGATTLYDTPHVARYAGVDRLQLKHEGENPTGSFKDRGMATGTTVARLFNATSVACASTGNTSASMASYAAIAGLDAYVFIPSGKIATGKLSQALAYGARTIQIDGNFDTAMQLVERVCNERGVYLLNSLNPFRVEGQKAIMLEILQDLRWEVPDWLVLPGGNLGNNSALFKALSELRCLGVIDRYPRFAIIQAAGANPLYRAFKAGKHHCESSGGRVEPLPNVETIASAIRIGDPISWRKTFRALRETDGVVEEVTDDEIMDAKSVVDRAGIGAEPASCATVAGLRKLVASGVIRSDERIVGVLTGHLLKDPDATTGYHLGTLDAITSQNANQPVQCKAELDAILKVLT